MEIRAFSMAATILSTRRLATGAAALALLWAGAAHAGTVIGATRVHITSANPDLGDAYIQVAEVLAVELGSGIDVALASQGATASAYDDYGSGGPAAAIDGVFPSPYPSIYHSTNSLSAYLDIVLSGSHTLTSLTIWGRQSGSGSRDIYNVSVFDGGGATLFAGVLDARTANFATVRFDDPPTTQGGVPEPTTWAMMIAGFAGVGAAMRRRRQALPA